MSSPNFAKVYNRLSFGLTPQIEAGPLWETYRQYEDWIESQLHPSLEKDLEAQAQKLNFLYMSPEDIFENFDDTKSVPKVDMTLLYEQLYRYRLYRATQSKFQLREVLSDFWLQHFNVDISKGDEKFVFRQYLDLIRENVFSSFENLQLTVYTTPNMMHFLDNNRSFKESINENFAREIFELHTVGQGAGYSQQDIIELAHVLTGWRCDYKKFYFDPEKHGGSQASIFGYAPKATLFDQGKEYLAYLATHEKTAHFICQKLATFFISDNPPSAWVEDLAKVYKKSKGQLIPVYRQIFLRPEFYEGRFSAKAKRPFYLMASALRTLESQVTNAIDLNQWLVYMGERQFRNPDPGGYKDHIQDWLSEDLLLVRIQFIFELLGERLSGVSSKIKNQEKLVTKLTSSHFQMR